MSPTIMARTGGILGVVLLLLRFGDAFYAPSGTVGAQHAQGTGRPSCLKRCQVIRTVMH